MVQAHVLDYFARPDVKKGWFGLLSRFLSGLHLAGPPVAPAFVFLMGASLHLSKASNSMVTDGLRRAARLLVMGYLVNIFSGTLPLWLAFQVGTITPDEIDTTLLSATLSFDVLQFAAVAQAICVILRHFFPYPSYWVALALLLAIVSPLTWSMLTGQQLVDETLKFLWGSEKHGAFFPVFPWLAYPLFGMAFGYWMKASIEYFFYKRVVKLSLLLIGIGAFIDWVFNMVDAFNMEDYSRMGPGKVIWSSGLILAWIFLSHIVVQKIQRSNFLELFLFWGCNVTTFFISQWTIIGWTVATGLPGEDFGILGTIVMMIGVTFLSDKATRFSVDLAARRKEEHVGAKITSEIFFWATNITTFFLSQWDIIGWGWEDAGIERDFGFVGTVIMMIVVTDLLDKVTRFWVDLTTARRKKDRIDAQIANGNRSSFGKHLRVRLASQSDRSAMCKLVVTNHLALSDDCPVEWTEQLCDIPEDYGHLIDADRFSLGHYRVAEYVDKNGVSNLAGVVGIVPKGHKKDKKKNPSTWVLTALSVNAECRGRGVGEQLLQAIISDARDTFSLRRLELETLKERMEPAWRLYEKVGFEKSDEVVAYPAEGHRKRSMTVYHYSLDL